MTDIIINGYIQGSPEASKGLTVEQNTFENTEEGLLVEPLKEANQQATDSLVERMISDQQEKVDIGIKITEDGTLDLNDGAQS